MKTPAPVTRRQFVSGASLLAGSLASLGIPAAVPTAAAAADRPSRFKYALNTGTIRGQKLSVMEQIEATAKAGYEGIEPWIGDLVKYVEGGGNPKDLAKRCQDLGLKVIDGIGFAQWAVPDEAVRAKALEQLKKEMDLLAQLGCPHIAAPPAGMNKAGTKLELDAAAERYLALLQLGQQLGVTPMLEIWGSSANLSHLAEAAYVAAKTGHPEACVLADVYHLYKGGSDPSALSVLGRHAVRVFHLNDYPAQPPRETIKDSDRIWPGDGIAPMKTILGNLAANHCEPWLSLELFNAEYYKLPALEAAKTGLAKMKASVAAAGLA